MLSEREKKKIYLAEIWPGEPRFFFGGGGRRNPREFPALIFDMRRFGGLDKFPLEAYLIKRKSAAASDGNASYHLHFYNAFD